MLLLLLTYHQVAPCYLNFITSYGSYSGATDLRFGGFRRQQFLAPDRLGPYIPPLGRSGVHYQISFKLQTIQRYEPHQGDRETPSMAELRGEQRWRRPTAAVYHQFDVLNGTALWVITSPLRSFPNSHPENRLWKSVHDGLGGDYHVSSDELHERFNASLGVILSIAELSVGDYSFYLQDKEELILEVVRPPNSFGRTSSECKSRRHVQANILDLDRIHPAGSGGGSKETVVSDHTNGVLADENFSDTSLDGKVFVHVPQRRGITPRG
jgi:hypothetical protein